MAPTTHRLITALSVAAALGLAGPAAAEVPPPPFDKHLGIQAWLDANQHIEAAGRLRAQRDPDRNATRAADLERQAQAELRTGLTKIAAYEAQVQPTSGLAYLKGLAHRLLHDDKAAETAWRRSIALDPTGAIDAHHDLGELLLSQQRWDEADASFAQVTAAITTGPQAWRGPLRQAEVAGWKGDRRALEAHLTEALRRGLNLTYLRPEPQWRTFLATPELHRTVEKMLLIYGSRELLDAMREP